MAVGLRYQTRSSMKKGDLVLLKAPQVVIARNLRRGGAFFENEYYLNADIFTKQFYQPAVEILGPCLHFGKLLW